MTTCLIGFTSPASADSLDSGWRLWLDPSADWKNDTLYLPSEVDLARLPVNPPTGGWPALTNTAGIPVSLPATVEQYYWGKAPANVLDPAKPNDVVGGNGYYPGVSWWYHDFIPPALAPGERLIFAFPGARLRAEVYVNGQLVGYDVVGETAFEADATAALKPGQSNLLAVRITNPGGTFSWGDFGTMKWGQYDLPTTHGFGGLDGGVTMTVRGPVAVTDLAVLNHPDPQSVTLTAEVTSTGPAYNGPVALNITQDGQPVWSGTAAVQVAASGVATVSTTVTVPGAKLWDIGQPNLYQASASLANVAHSGRSTNFGFRWFTAEGLGNNAILTLNGRRIVVKSAISWGYWAPNGIFPDQAAAQRDVASVQALGLNCVQNHRHMPKPIVLDAYDRAGLMRYCEPGGGDLTYQNPPGTPAHPVGPIDSSGKGGEPTTFANKYELYKLLSMIKSERSHPSVIVWNLQNEAVAGVNNPKLFYAMHQMREADPSRIIVSQSGIGRTDEVWALPYETDLRVETHGAAGWSDQHTAVSSYGVYADSEYTSPTQYQYFTDDTKEISMWGEMATGASPDDHGQIAAWYKAQNIPGYDRAAHEAVVAGYDQFLDTHGFRADFPTVDDVFRGAADMHYFASAMMLENARICDANDYLVLSGWESTTVDNHSGMVDELRNPKTDPAPIKAAAAPDLLVIRARHYVVAKGTPATIDVHLVNENVLQGPFTLTVFAKDQAGSVILVKSFPVTVPGGNLFAQLLKDDIELTPNSTGYITLTANLAQGVSPAVLTGSARIYVVDTNPAPLTGTVAVLGASQFGDALTKQFGLAAPALAAGAPKVDTIVVDSAVGPRSLWQRSTTPNDQMTVKQNSGYFTQQSYGGVGPVAHFEGLANGVAHVDLFFMEPYFASAGKRVFDVALNGTTVLQNFDIFAAAGGKNIGLVKSFDVPLAYGAIDLSIPKVETDQAIFSAIRITDAKGQVIRRLFGTHDYHDVVNDRWLPVQLVGFDWNQLSGDILKRVHDDGTRLVIVSNDTDAGDIQEAALALAKQGVMTFQGLLGNSSAPWMGRWYFGKKHWLLNGLPAGCVLDWPYQITGGNGLLMDAPGLDTVLGYGINHSPTPAVGTAVIPYGKGQIVLFCIPGLGPSFKSGTNAGIDPVTADRIIYNSLAGSQLVTN